VTKAKLLVENAARTNNTFGRYSCDHQENSLQSFPICMQWSPQKRKSAINVTQIQRQRLETENPKISSIHW